MIKSKMATMVAYDREISRHRFRAQAPADRAIDQGRHRARGGRGRLRRLGHAPGQGGVNGQYGDRVQGFRGGPRRVREGPRRSPQRHAHPDHERFRPHRRGKRHGRHRSRLGQLHGRHRRQPRHDERGRNREAGPEQMARPREGPASPGPRPAPHHRFPRRPRRSRLRSTSATRKSRPSSPATTSNPSASSRARWRRLSRQPVFVNEKDAFPLFLWMEEGPFVEAFG